MKTKTAIIKFNYLTSRNYLTWLLASVFFFLPATMVVFLINATAEGLCVAGNYLKQRDFPISFSYRTYLNSRAYIEKRVRQL